MWPESKHSFERNFAMPIKYLASCACWGPAESPSSDQHNPPQVPGQALLVPEGAALSAAEFVMLQLGASCLSPSTYSGLRFLPFSLPNKQKKKSRPWLTEPWHYWGRCRTWCLPTEANASDLQKVHIPPNLPASLSTAAHAEQHLEPVSLLSPPASADGGKCTLILNND